MTTTEIKAGKRTQHTPGPWKTSHTFPYCEEQGDWVTDIDRQNGDRCIGRLIQASTRSLSESEANARLIAAAPELLEACEDALKLMRRHDLDHAWTQGVADAIEKATGIYPSIVKSK